MTPGQLAFADGHSANLAEHGRLLVRESDSAVVPGYFGTLRPSDPRIAGAQDRVSLYLVADRGFLTAGALLASQVMPSTRVARGDILSDSFRNFSVVRLDYSDLTGLWELILSGTF